MDTLTDSLEQAYKIASEWIESAPQRGIDSSAFPSVDVTTRDLLEHGRKVASILQAWGADSNAQFAALFHSLLWNCVISPEMIAERCGNRVSFLCQEYQRILKRTPETRWRGKPHILEQIRYFTLAYRDRDLALIGAADLWSHFQLSQEGSTAHRRKYQEYARDVIQPYFHFLGMSELSETLQREVQALSSSSSAKRRQQSNQNGNGVHYPTSTEPEDEIHVAFSQVCQQIAECLPNATATCRNLVDSQTLLVGGAPVTTQARVTADNPTENSATLSSASRFWSQPNLHVNLVVADEADCYEALFRLHQHFTPIEGSLADLIANGRRNGFRCLQTTVIGTVIVSADRHDSEISSPEDTAVNSSGSNGLYNEPHVTSSRVRIHFKICTPGMDEINRWGLVAAHWKNQHEEALPNAWWNTQEDTFSLIESAPLGSLNETLYVFSPNGELFGFHRGCTVVDYAYNVHSELAAQCRRFFINGEAVEPATALHHLDLVELEHDPAAGGPTRVWLNAARTPRARTHIDRYLKRHGQGIYHAQKTLDKRLKALEEHYGFNMPEQRVNQALSKEMKRRQINSTEGLMAEISSGQLNADRILHPLFADEIIRQVQIPAEVRLRPHQLVLAQCCRPKPGNDIIGRPYTRNKIITKLTIHRLHCKKLGSQSKGYLPLKWRLQPALRAVAQIEMRALDENGLLADAFKQIYTAVPQVTLHRSESLARNGVATARFVIEAPSAEIIDEIVDGLRRLPGRTVDEVRQINLPLSEREALVKPVSTSHANPYSRMPVYEEGMFFGRSKELREIREWLRTRVGIIWLLGQKRVGKTSLLLHLQNHFLDSKEFTPIYLDFQMLSSLRPSDIFFEIANSVYSELQSEGHGAELGPPLHTMFEHDPSGHVIRYLLSAQSHPGVGKLVLLLDEFSRTSDAFQQGRLNEGFFSQWRGLVQMTQPNVKFVIVVQQQAFDSMLERVQGGMEDPSWQLMELGEKRILHPLTDKDARNLIEWPIRNYLDISDELLDHVYALTGGSPFLIQSFCFRLVSYMIQQDKRQVEWADLDNVRLEFMSPNESLFAHLLDLIRGVANSVSGMIAQLADEESSQKTKVIPTVTWAQITAALPTIPHERLHNTLDELCERHILVLVSDERDEKSNERWRFSSLLFQEWLALNSPTSCWESSHSG